MLRSWVGSDKVLTCGSCCEAAHAKWEGSDTDVVRRQRIETLSESKPIKSKMLGQKIHCVSANMGDRGKDQAVSFRVRGALCSAQA